MSGPALQWIVASRRAVVRQTIAYSDLIRQWIMALNSDRDALQRWYSVSAGGYIAGRGQILQWLQIAFPQESGVAAPRDTTTTLDLPAVPFWVRLWKGPLRVLLELGDNPVLGTEITDSKKTDFQHEGQVKLELNDNGEAINSEARFLMGDVVEFPLFKFLAAAGLKPFGGNPPYEDQLTFNGQGSFLLGTSLKDSGGASPPASPILHDNLVAMRFQMLLNGFRGAFYHLDQPVFIKRYGAVEAASGPRTVYARGFIYAGELSRASGASVGSQEHWRLNDGNWCMEQPSKPIDNVAQPNQLSFCVPTKAGMDGLSKDFVVTPGGTCSPTTLYFTNYMMRYFRGPSSKDGVYYGGDSVGTTMNKNPAVADITQSYEWVPKADIAKLVPEISEEEMRARLDRLIAQLEPILAMVDGDQSFMRQNLTQAQGWPEWSAVRPETEKKITQNVDRPAALMEVLRTNITGKTTKPEEAAVTERLHAALATAAQQFGTAFDGPMGTLEWKTYSGVGPDFGNGSLKTDLGKVKAITCPGGPCKQRHDFSSVEHLRDNLKQKLKNLKAKQASKTKLSGGPRRDTIDFGPQAGDVNSVSLDGHEWGIFRVFPHEKLLQSTSLPQAGFVAAYEPLDGTPCADAAMADQLKNGQLYVFEEGDWLFQWPKDYNESQKRDNRSAYGAGPHKWELIDKNKCTIAVNGNDVAFGQGTQPRYKPLLGITRLRGTPGGSGPLADAHLQDPKAFRPLFVYPVKGAVVDSDFKKAYSRLVQNGMKLYISRAVPYPSMLEVADAFAPKANVQKEIDRLGEAGLKALNQLNQDLLDAVATTKKDDVGKDELKAAKSKVADSQRYISYLFKYLTSLGLAPKPELEYPKGNYITPLWQKYLDALANPPPPAPGAAATPAAPSPNPAPAGIAPDCTCAPAH